MKNDLHIRTNFSASADKDCNYEKVLKLCEEQKLDRISITDFDTCIFSVINKIKDNSKLFSGEIINGMECDVCENGITFELLAYNFEPFKTLDWSYKTYGTLEGRQTKIKDALCDVVKSAGYKVNEKIKFNGKVDFAHKFVYENMLSFKQNEELFKKYNIQTLTDFYNLSTKQKDFPLYLDMGKIWPNTKSVVDFIHSVDGIVCLAQPFKSTNRENVDFLLENAVKNGVDGIEVYHPTHTEKDIAYLLDFCKKHKLIVVGGSNFNGKPNNDTVGIKNIDAGQKYILKKM